MRYSPEKLPVALESTTKIGVACGKLQQHRFSHGAALEKNPKWESRAAILGRDHFANAKIAARTSLLQNSP
jgi:hypothetical protein